MQTRTHSNLQLWWQWKQKMVDICSGAGKTDWVTAVSPEIMLSSFPLMCSHKTFGNASCKCNCELEVVSHINKVKKKKDKKNIFFLLYLHHRQLGIMTQKSKRDSFDLYNSSAWKRQLPIYVCKQIDQDFDWQAFFFCLVIVIESLFFFL